MSTAPVPNFALASFSMGQTQTYDELLSDGHHITSRMGSVASGGGKLKRGTIVKIVPATGVVTVPATAAECNAVIAENIDATSATVACLVYLSGKMKADALIWPGALPHADVADALRNYGILVESVLFRDGIIVKSAPTEEQAEAAKERIETLREAHGEPPAGEAPDLTGGVADSSWSYLTEEERATEPHLAGPLPAALVEEEEAPVTEQPVPATQPAPQQQP